MGRSSLPLLGLLLSLTACASAPGGPAASPEAAAPEPLKFPTKSDLGKLAAAPAPARLFEDKGKDVPTWVLAGPLPDTFGDTPHEAASPWEKMLADAVAARPGRLFATEAMHCVARENALFYLENETLPAEPLERFIAARCGAPSSAIGMAFHGGKIDDRITDEKILADLGETARKTLAKLVSTGDLNAGVSFVRSKGRAAVAFTAAPRKVLVDSRPLVPGPDGKVVVRGELREPAVSVRAVINRGRFGFARCVGDASVKLPRFAFECASLPEDEAAWLEVAAFPPGRLLGSNVLEMLVWPSGKPGKTYAKMARAKAPGAPDASAQAPDLVRAINEMRKEAGIGELRLAERESQTASQLAPHYFAAVSGAVPETQADEVALGLRAGWDVEGMVRYGTFASTWVQDAVDYDEVLRAALARPFGRETLLDPTVERIAIGTVDDPKQKILGAVFSTYALFDGYKHDKDLGTVTGRLNALRAERKLGPIIALPEVSADLARAGSAVQLGQSLPREALNAMLQAASEHLGGGGVRGWALETTSLDEMKFPDDLVNRAGLRVAFSVAHYRPQGQPWGRFVIFCVSADDGPAMTASAGAPHAG